MVLSFSTSDKNTNLAQPKCSVFGECGGCFFQNLPYEKELKFKEEHLHELFLKHLNIKKEVLRPIIPSPKEYHYRNRLDMVLRKTKSQEVFIGFTKKNSRDVIDLDVCPIAMESVSSFIPTMKKEAKTMLPEKYRMASLMIRSGDDGRVIWGGIGRGSLKQKQEDYLWTEISGKRIHYSMESFFQANLSILPNVMEVIRALDLWSSETTLFDLYGGVGLFGIMLSDLVGQVILVEDVAASTQVAQYNVQYLGIKNIKIQTGTVEHQLPALLKQNGSKPCVAFIDPPRAGLKEEALKALKESQELKNILYLSCNPVSMVANLQELSKTGWTLKQAWPMDFFPKTRHLEALVLLARP